MEDEANSKEKGGEKEKGKSGSQYGLKGYGGGGTKREMS